jgi:hypothetical protein
MSYENAHSDGYGGDVSRLHFFGTAFDASSGSGDPGGSGYAAEPGVSRHAGVTCYARGSSYAGSACGTSAARSSC